MVETAQQNDLSALLVGEFETDRLLVHDVFRKFGWRLFEARDRRRAMRCLNLHPVHVVIAGASVPNWNWKKVLNDLRRFLHPPQLIVASRSADESLWSEALNIGAYDVLAQPLAREEVERVVAAARRYFDQARKHPRRQTLPAAANVA